jgi:undecaprenyl-diphosphatase
MRDPPDGAVDGVCGRRSGVRRRGASEPHDGWTSEVSSGLALAGFLFLAFVGFTLLAMGPLISLDAYFKLDPAPPSWLPFLHVLDRIGQRAVCLPILAVATVVCCRYRSSWRPVWLVAGSVFCLNLLVLILKVLLGRGQPASVDPAFFVGGIAYPSGHTSNIMLVYGLVVYLLGHYRRISTGLRRSLWAGVFVLSITMVLTSLTLDWHWFADLIAGLLVGGTVLQLTATVDAALPATALHDGPLTLLRAVRRRVLRRAPQPGGSSRPVPEPRTPATTAATSAEATAVPPGRSGHEVP